MTFDLSQRPSCLKFFVLTPWPALNNMFKAQLSISKYPEVTAKKGFKWRPHNPDPRLFTLPLIRNFWNFTHTLARVPLNTDKNYKLFAQRVHEILRITMLIALPSKNSLFDHCAAIFDSRDSKFHTQGPQGRLNQNPEFQITKPSRTVNDLFHFLLHDRVCVCIWLTGPLLLSLFGSSFFSEWCRVLQLLYVVGGVQTSA